MVIVVIVICCCRSLEAASLCAGAREGVWVRASCHMLWLGAGARWGVWRAGARHLLTLPLLVAVAVAVCTLQIEPDVGCESPMLLGDTGCPDVVAEADVCAPVDPFHWAPAAVQAVLRHSPLLAVLSGNFQHPVLLTTDYSGYGCCETAMGTLLQECRNQGYSFECLVWRSADILASRQRMLTTSREVQSAACLW